MKNKVRIKAIIATFSPFLAPYKWGLIGAIVMVIITNLTFAFLPSIEGLITTRLFEDVQNMMQQKASGVSYDYIIRIMLILAGGYLTKTVSQMLGAVWLTNSIQNAMHDVRAALQRKIQRLPVEYFDHHQYGDVLSKITNDVDSLSNALQQTLMQVIGGILGISLAVFMMMQINVGMACLAFIIIPFGLVVSMWIVKHSQKRFRMQQDALGDLNGTITEMYSGYNEIMLFNQQEKSIQKFRKMNDTLCNYSFRAQFASSIIQPLTALGAYLVLGGIAIMGTFQAIAGAITVGQLQAFVRYVWQVYDPISQVSQMSSTLQSAVAAAGRIYEILNEKEEIQEPENAVTLKEVKQGIVFDHVAFSYQEDKELITDLNVEVKPGQMVAIVGPTGAGKTTLINLLMRFYDVKQGAIRIDGVDLREMKREDLRQLFGMVLQDTWLFSGTIQENLRYGNLNARQDEIIEACKMANVHHFIRTLPNGYQMLINEEGSNISQGEKQLLTIARAILKNPQILILDEATSSVDTRLEKMLQDAMAKLMENRTSFVIAHRLSTIKNADLILVMQHGNIVEQGTHEELLKKNGHYAALYYSQFASMQE